MPQIGTGDRVQYLDWLRALAVALVVVGHSANPLAPGGAIGVSVFFVLSGYLITSILLKEGMLTVLNVAKFILRRMARIWPMYAAVIGLMILITSQVSPPMFAVWRRDAIGLLTFQALLSEWTGTTGGILWTLYVEFWFYVTFPFLLAVASCFNAIWLLILGGITLSLLAKMIGVGDLAYLYYDQLLIGAAAAYAHRTGVIPAFIKRPNTATIAIIAILALGLLLPFWHRNFIWWIQSLLTCCATAVAILAWATNPPKMHLPIVSYLGLISYSIYYVHAMILDLIFKTTEAIPKQLPLYFLVTVALSSITFAVIEQPFNKLAKRYLPFDRSQRRKPAPST